MFPYNYNPKPARVWTRVENACAFNVTNVSENDLVYIPLTKQTVSPIQATQINQMIKKGNVLQYKKNSGNMTKNQRYSQIAKGKWTSKQSYATQGFNYTNPNTTGLLRVNYNVYPNPNFIVGQPNNPSGPFQPNVPNPNNCPNELIVDGGSLVCNKYADPCTGEIIQTINNPTCFPTTCSDVPGPIQGLCWNPAIQTWFPRNKLTMNNSANGWPNNYKGFVSAVYPATPTLTGTLNNNNTNYINGNTVFLNWYVQTTPCLPILSWNVYQNGILILNIPYLTYTTINNLSENTTYTFYVVGIVNNTTQTSQSNNVTINIPPVVQTNVNDSPSLFTTTGNPTVYNNNGYTGVVFDYNVSGNQSITFNTNMIVSLIIIGGGGNGNTYDEGFNGSSGGGGGGVTYVQNYNISQGTYNVTVGSASSSSSFNNLISYGGTTAGNNGASNGGNGGNVNNIYGGGGGTGGSANFDENNTYGNAGGYNSNYGNIGHFTTGGNGGSSFYSLNSIPLQVPFINSSATIQGGGGGNGSNGGNGGSAGYGVGGGIPSSTINGANGYNSIYTGYGGGGGGGGGESFPSTTLGTAGIGGNGVVIIYWSTTSNYINTNNFTGNYVVYNNNNYIGYVFNYGSGNIIFNNQVNNATIILCGGGGCGGDASENLNYNIGGGGGGGGSVIYSSQSFTTNEQINISVGIGGNYNISGTSSTFNSYIAYYGTNSTANSCVGGNGGNGGGSGGGGGGGGGGFYNNTPQLGGTGGSGGSGNGQSGFSNSSSSNGGNSYTTNANINVNVPFIGNSAVINLGGGGGAGYSNAIGYNNGCGAQGNGGGGSADVYMDYGGSAINSIYTGYGGGGGGSDSFINSGGLGGNGVIIIYWPTN